MPITQKGFFTSLKSGSPLQYATLRISKSDNIADVSNQLGHFSETYTMKIYYQWMPGKKKSEVDELDDQEFKDRKEAKDKNRRAV